MLYNPKFGGGGPLKHVPPRSSSTLITKENPPTVQTLFSHRLLLATLLVSQHRLCNPTQLRGEHRCQLELELCNGFGGLGSYQRELESVRLSLFFSF